MVTAVATMAAMTMAVTGLGGAAGADGLDQAIDRHAADKEQHDTLSHCGHL